MTKDKALEMALMFIERVNRDGWILEDFEPQMYEAITAIKEALETKDEPVSCAECGVGGGHALYCVACAEKFVKREWVGLTDNEYQDILIKHDNGGLLSFYNLVEEKLRQKNTE